MVSAESTSSSNPSYPSLGMKITMLTIIVLALTVLVFPREITIISQRTKMSDWKEYEQNWKTYVSYKFCHWIILAACVADRFWRSILAFSSFPLFSIMMIPCWVAELQFWASARLAIPKSKSWIQILRELEIFDCVCKSLEGHFWNLELSFRYSVFQNHKKLTLSFFLTETLSNKNWDPFQVNWDGVDSAPWGTRCEWFS